MAEKCTKTSSPVERCIKPYPLAPLNHFTVPFSFTNTTPFASASDRGHCINQDGRIRSCLPVSTIPTNKRLLSAKGRPRYLQPLHRSGNCNFAVQETSIRIRPPEFSLRARH